MTRPAIPVLPRWRPRAGAALAVLCFAVVAGNGAAGEPEAEKVPARAEARGSEEPVEGITANGQPVFGLFPIEATGVSTEPLVAAAGAFLEALGERQRERARLAVDDPEWRRWSSHEAAAGAGISLAEMSQAARKAALELLEASLSGRGFALTGDLMRSGEWQYRIAVMGEPSASEPWGWQLEGDHLVINYFVLGDQVVMSPLFMGAEPVTSGSTAALQDEQDQGRAMLRSLGEAQRQMALIGTPGVDQEIVAGESGDNAILENVGIPAALMDGEQRATLLALVELYVGNLRQGHAAVKMTEVEAYLDDTYFAWSGGGGDDSAFYYRIFSPVVLIELDSRTSRDHVHAVIRTPNGNDYGEALLRRHLAGHPHD